MRTKGLFVLFVFFVTVLFSYDTARAQDVDKTKATTAKPAAETAKPQVIVTDSLAEAAKAKEEAAKPVTTTKSFGNHAVTVSEGVVGQTQQSGKWHTVTTWDGTKWVSKREFFPTKKP